MNDAEIIKVLESMADEDSENFSCDVLDLIRRQQADIEKLATQNVKLKKCFTIEFDDDKLEEIVQKAADRITIDIKQAKNEAIREFADKIKARLQDVSRLNNDGTVYFLVGYELIEKIAKEMTGGDE